MDATLVGDGSFASRVSGGKPDEKTDGQEDVVRDTVELEATGDTLKSVVTAAVTDKMDSAVDRLLVSLSLCVCAAVMAAMPQLLGPLLGRQRRLRLLVVLLLGVWIPGAY